MGLMEFLRQWQPGRLAAGVAASVVLHLIIVALAMGIRLLPASRYDVTRGEPLIVELPKGEDSPPPGLGGTPAARPSAPSAPPSAAQAPPTRPAPRAVAKSAPRAADLERRPPPTPQPEPAPRVATAVPPKTPDAAPVAAPQPASPEPDASRAAEPAPAESMPRPAADRQVASLPPPSQPPGRGTPDTLTALRRGAGGAGGSGDGRAGIEGEPIPLDSTDPRYSDYLEQVRRRIKEKWGYPCEKNEQTQVCEYRSTQLIIDFGIAKSGELVFVTLTRTSGHAIYDDYALNAVKLASPFPPIPHSFSKKGVPIQASFHYVLQSTLTNILR
jgi:protein TonB